MLPTVLRQFIIFCCIGVGSTAINYAIFYLLFQFLAIFYLLASSVGFLTGMCFSFYCNVRYNFKQKQLATGKHLLLYGAVNIVSLSASLGALYFQVESIGIHPLIAHLFSILLSTVINFFGLRLMLVKSGRTSGESS